MKSILRVMCLILCLGMIKPVFAETGYEWANQGVSFCTANGILQGDEYGNLNLGNNITRAEMAKVISKACMIQYKNEIPRFSDVLADNWAYNYILNIQEFIAHDSTEYRPFDFATREEFISCLIYAKGINTENLDAVYMYSYPDYKDISWYYQKSMNAAVFYGYIKGDERGLRPKENLTRAEACVLLERILNQPAKIPAEIPQPTESNYIYTTTLLLAPSEHTMEQAVAWAKRNNAAQCFIDVAPYYWYYGDVFGIRADVLYAQAAKETAFGRYTGRVTQDMNNWAGIKKYGATGDETFDHESFLTPDDGVRAHFNHISAYVGVAPVGETHGRYKSVKSLSWAGTVKYVEQLGGKWCPDSNYGYSIMNDYVNKM